MVGKILGLILGRHTASAAVCYGPTYYQYGCVVVNGVYGRGRRQCFRDSCSGRIFCGSWQIIGGSYGCPNG